MLNEIFRDADSPSLMKCSVFEPMNRVAKLQGFLCKWVGFYNVTLGWHKQSARWLVYGLDHCIFITLIKTVFLLIFVMASMSFYTF